MHYYNFNIADYRKRTNHLSLLEHAIYRALMDTYYLEERPLSKDKAWLMRSHSVRTVEEERALNNVLSDFFHETDEGYRHSRCDEELAVIYRRSLKARKSAEARWKKHRKNSTSHTQEDAKGSQECDGIADAELPKTKNPIPIVKGDKKKEKWDEINIHSCTDSQESKSLKEEYYCIALEMWSLIQPLTQQRKEPNLDAWAGEIRKLVEVDKYPLNQSLEVFKWANRDEFWQTNILCPKSLRKQFGRLLAQMNRKKTTDNGGESKERKTREIPLLQDLSDTSWAQ